MKQNYAFDWSELAFGNKKPLRELKATFIMAPRELSSKRFTQLVKQYLPQGNIVLGLAKESYITGFDNQPQFKTLQLKAVSSVINKVNQHSKAHKIYTLSYFQPETKYIIESLRFKQVIGINGSWKYAFHTQEVYYTLASKQIDYSLVSPFADEDEAKAYEKCLQKQLPKSPLGMAGLNEQDLLEQATIASTCSYDYNFQTGAALAKKQGKNYKLLMTAYNAVVPFQTYAMHYGASRETNLSPPHDLNHYDTVHAEVMLVIEAAKAGINLKGTTVFINLLPCPPCARMLSQTDIAEIVYLHDHSEGYAFSLLQKAGKTVRRLAAEV